MTGSVVLDVAIGMCFVYLSCSILCSSLVEFIAGKLNWRSERLEAAIRKLLSGDAPGKGRLSELADQVLGHSLVNHLAPHGEARPSYIPSRTFALALFDALGLAPGPAGKPVEGEAAPPANSNPALRDKESARALESGPGPGARAATPVSLEALRDSVGRLPDGELKSSLGTLLGEAEDSLDKARANVETWFNDAMTRLSGAYKRHVQAWNLLIASALCLALNVDTLCLINAISYDPGVRSALVGAAVEKAKNPSTLTNAETASAKLLAEELRGLRQEATFSRLPLGWENVFQSQNRTEWEWARWGALKLIGLLFSTLAVSLGAPFWFDLLGKVVNLRSTGARPTH